MQQVFVIGDEPVPGYRLAEEIEGSAFSKIWGVDTPEGIRRQWKVIDLVVGNAAIETRTLGLLVRLRHAHVNALTNFWNLDDGKTLIIESEVPKFTLKDRLIECQGQGQTGLSHQEAVAYLMQAAEGLDFLNKAQHEYNGQQVAIYHRALRPECLLVFDGEQGERVCKVSDFGLSKPVTEEVAQHSQGLLHYDFDPPEFFEGQTTPTSDQFSLAVVYYQLRTGEMPYRGTMLEQLQSRLSDRPDLSKLQDPERAIIARALKRDPNLRYKSCVELMTNLRDGTTAVGGTASSTVAADPASPAPSGGVPRPQTSNLGSPGWRSPAAGLSASGDPAAEGALPVTMTPPPRSGPVFQRPQVLKTDSVLKSDSVLIRTMRPTQPASAPVTDTDPLLKESVETIPAAAVANPRKGVKPRPVKGDLKSIREHLASSQGMIDSSGGDGRIPLIWVSTILAVTAIGSVWVANLLSTQ